MSTTGSLLSVYYHLPFCRHKCPYCHFFVHPYDRESESMLFEGLRLELEQKRDLIRQHEVISLYFGGGTPSLVDPCHLEKIIGQFPLAHEITLEANPEDVTPSLAKTWKNIGINRISIGVQTLDDSLLQFLERRHSAEKAKEAIYAVYEAGIENISIDLMFELPHQNLDQFSQTLLALNTLPITHLSLYNLCYEVGSAYYKREKQLSALQPPPEVGLEMLNFAIQHLEKIGLKRYEISAFAKEGYHSMHNLGYWQGRPFFGLGPSAFSYYGGKRFRNHCHLKKWKKALDENLSPTDFEEKLPEVDREKEMLAVGLRVLDGLPNTFSPPIQHLLSQLIERGWVAEECNRVWLTEEGLLFYDDVAEFII